MLFRVDRKLLEESKIEWVLPRTQLCCLASLNWIFECRKKLRVSWI